MRPPGVKNPHHVTYLVDVTFARLAIILRFNILHQGQQEPPLTYPDKNTKYTLSFQPMESESSVSQNQGFSNDVYPQITPIQSATLTFIRIYDLS